MNKRGFAEQIMTVMVVGVIIAVVIMFLWGIVMVAPIATDLTATAGTVLKEQATGTGDSDISTAMDSSINPVLGMADSMKYISYIIILGVFLAFFICMFYIRTYPFILGFWIIFMVIMVFASMFMTNAYMDIIADNSQASLALQSWTGQHFILSNLPVIMTIFGVVGGIVLFSLITREKEGALTL